MKPRPAEVQAFALCTRPSGSLAGIIARKARKLFSVHTCLLLSVFALITASVSYSHSAELDEARHFRLESGPPVVWENLRDSPQFLFGVKPTYSLKNRLHLCVLEPGESTTFLVPPNEMIRVAEANGKVDWSDVELWTSNGSGLYQRQMSGQCKCGTSLLAAPGAANLTIARICRPADKRCAATIAIFTSRCVAIPVLDTYRMEFKVSNCERVYMSDDGGQTIQSMSRIGPGQRALLTVAGPTWLKIETRFRYQPTDARSRQSYHIRLLSNGELLRVLEFATSSESKRRVTVNGQEVSVSKQESAFTNIDAGNSKLEIECSAPIFCRVLESATAIQHPRLNGSVVRDRVVLEEPVSIWDTRRPTTETVFTDDQAAYTFAALRSARDNEFPRGGLRSYMLIRKLSATSSESHRMRRFAEGIRSNHTTFRDLLPVNSSQEIAPVTATFASRKLRDPREPLTTPSLKQQFIHDAVGQLSRARFVRLSNSPNEATVYRLPGDLGSSILRIAVDRASTQFTTRLIVQYDRRRPIQLEIVPSEPVDDDAFESPRSKLGLSALRRQHGHFDAGTLGGPFAQLQTPVPHIRVASAELFMPADVVSIRIWAEAPSDACPNVALQYLDGRRYELTETSLHDSLCQTGTTKKLEVLFDNQRQEQYESRELQNHAVALKRLTNSHQRDFAQSIANASPIDSSDVRPVSNKNLSTLYHSAMQLSADKQWPAAIETWSELVNAAHGDQRSSARIQRAEALRRAGEHFLAERELRGLAQFGDPHTRQLAIGRLVRWKQDAEDTRGVERLYSVATAIDRTDEHVAGLARSLLLNQRWDAALTVALAIPFEVRPNDVVVRAAFQLAWWKTFDQAVSMLPEPSQYFWQAQKLLRFGKYDQAREEFALAGKQGERIVRHLDRGFKIHQAITASERTTRLRGIADWQDWQAEHPGPTLWREEPNLVESCSAFATVHSSSRDIYTNYASASPGHPIAIRVLGPMRLQIEVRPLHNCDSEKPIDDWLHVVGQQMRQVIALTHNRPATGLNIVSDKTRIPGGTVRAEIQLAAGHHQLDITPENSEVLVRFKVARPELPLPVLPPLNEHTVNKVLVGSFGTAAERRHRVARGVNPWTQEPRTTASPSGATSKYALPLMSPFQGSDSAPDTHPGVNTPFTAAVGESPDPPTFATEGLNRVEETLRSTKWDGRETAPQRARTTTLHRAAMLVWTAEHEPKRRHECLIALYELCENHPELRELATLRNRLARTATWKSFREFESSAGIHAIEIEGWQPESPSLRIRKSLLAPRFDADHILSAEQDLVLNLRDDRATVFEIVAARPQLSFLPTSPTLVEWQLDDGEPHVIRLTDPTLHQTFRVEVSAGQHQLRVRVKNPMAFHYVLLKIRERTADGQSVALEPRRRFYQVATVDEPVRFSLEGPAVVRIDERRGKTTLTRIETVIEGIRQFELNPAAGQKAALYRVFELLDDPQRQSPQSAPIELQLEEQPRPWLDPLVDAVFASGPPRIADLSLMSPDAPAPNVNIDDEFPLGSQERGTWSLGMGLFQRAALEEDNNLARPGQFMQFNATRYRFDAWNNKHLQTDLLLRTRNAAGPVFGLVHNQWQSLPSLRSIVCNCGNDGHPPIDFSTRGFVFLQRPGTSALPASPNTHVTVGLQGRISQTRRWSSQAYHKPSMTVFGRWLTMDQNTFGPAEADEDIFTPFKSNHRIGMRISDRFIYQRNLDNKWWLRPALMTNENFNLAKPDNVSLQGGVSQLWGPLELQFSYKAIRYLSDNDRRNNSTQHLFYADAILERWRCAGRRNQMSLSFRHDLGDGDTSTSLVFTTFFDHGRGYRDMHPSRVSYLPIRKDRTVTHLLPPHLTN